jgi:hypothetical protein
MRSSSRILTSATAAAAILTMVVSGVALADDLRDTVNGNQAVSLTAGSPQVGTASISVQARNNDGDNGCNIDPGDTLKLDVLTPPGVTATPDPVEFTDCNQITVSFVASATAQSGTVKVEIASGADSGELYSNEVDIPITIVQPLDTTKPTLSLPGNITAAATGPTGAVVTFSATAEDANPASPTVSCSPASGATFPVGTTTVNCSARDAANNEATGSFTVTVTPYVAPDTTAPTLNLPEDITRQATGPSGAEITYTATADDADPAHPTVTCTPASGSTFAVATTTVNCSATDAANNEATGSFTVTVTPYDVTPPVVTVPGNVTAEATSRAGAPVTYGAATAVDDRDGPLPATCLPASGTSFPMGDTTVTCSATDAAGNTGTAIFTVTVGDSAGPELTLPAPITAEATSASGATVDYTASARDAVDGDLPISCYPASGATFALGTTTVDCSAADESGHPSSGGFTVTVADSVAPQLTVPPTATIEASDRTGAAFEFAATATDAVDEDVDVTCTRAGGLFPIGTTDVSCTATDDSGNETTKSFSITVSDTRGPTLALPEDLVAEATGPAGAVVTFDATALDAVAGDVPVTCAPVSGSMFGPGDTTVECTATDGTNPTDGAFTVTVQDTTPPELDLPESAGAEATGPDGAQVTFTATATDIVDGDVTVSCDPASGSTFPLDESTVTCTATDAAGNEAKGTILVIVTDKTGPAVIVPADEVVAEATGPNGAMVDYADLVSAEDAVDGAVTPSCAPLSGTVFALGETAVGCSATDSRGNGSIDDSVFTVRVVDTTDPAITVPADIVAEATGPNGADVAATATATDTVDTDVTVDCIPAAETFEIGTTTVTCTATDDSGNTDTGTFTVTVQDTTAPEVTAQAPAAAEATSPDGAVVTFTASATDAVTDSPAVTCTPASGSTFAIGTTPVTCTATDAAGNKGTKSIDVVVRDTLAPTNIAFVGGPAAGGSYLRNAVPPLGTCTARDGGSGVRDCVVTHTGTSPGTWTMTATATDNKGNAATATATYTVRTLRVDGFFAPVDMAGVWNTVKAGSTVPLKFRAFDGTTERTDVAVVPLGGATTRSVSCAGGGEDSIEEFVNTGATTLRYDTTGRQFIQNWKTPTKAGTCYSVTVTTVDGTVITALFKLK